MANFNKAFNFRGGFQVDTDILVVRGQNVGIGSSIPNDRLVVDGNIKAKSVGVDSISIQRSNVGILTVTEFIDVGVEKGSTQPYPLGSPQVRISTGIITAANPAIGFVTYYGDGGKLLNLPTSQWVDTDVGLGFTSIYAAGNVGVGTTDPRYVFQVGANPIDGGGFNTTGRGFAVELGSIIATDNILLGGRIDADGDILIGGGANIGGSLIIGGDVSIGGTQSSSFDGSISIGGSLTVGSSLDVADTVTAQELIGIGSQITQLDANYLVYGSLSSNIYGDLIVTKEVIADRFIGTATTAEDLTEDAQITIDTITVNSIDTATLDASDRITSLGTITVGHNDTGAVGGIDLRRVGSDSTIYSLTDTSFSARVFVGHERQESSNNGLGGIRFGGNAPSSPLSGVNDLDVVNFDVGNLNFYLHEGNPAGGTTGSFRWIDGQLDLVMAELTNTGGFKLTGNGNPFGATLEVSSGFSTFKGAATFDTTISVVGNAVFGGDVSVAGEISFGSILFDGPVQVPSLVVDTSILLGADPTIGGTGVIINSTGSITVSNSFNVGSSVLSSSGINVNTLSATTGTINTLSANTLDANTISNGSYTIASNGNATFNTVTANSLNIPNLSIPTATFTTVDTTTLNAANGNFTTSVNTPAITGLSDLTVSGQLLAGSATFATLTFTNLVLPGPFTLDDIDVANTTQTRLLNVTDQATISSLSASTIQVDELIATKTIINPGLEYIKYERSGNDLSIKVYTNDNQPIGITTLSLVPFVDP